MSQAIDLVLEDEKGEIIDQCFDVGGHFALAIKIADISNTVCLQVIDPYGDTVFNHLQVPNLIEELDLLLNSFSGEGSAETFPGQDETSIARIIQQISNFIQFANQAIGKNHTYLKFLGD